LIFPPLFNAHGMGRFDARVAQPCFPGAAASFQASKNRGPYKTGRATLAQDNNSRSLRHHHPRSESAEAKSPLKQLADVLRQNGLWPFAWSDLHGGCGAVGAALVTFLAWDQEEGMLVAVRKQPDTGDLSSIIDGERNH
jgi:hypothetical protein